MSNYYDEKNVELEEVGGVLYATFSSQLYESLAEVTREYIANEIDEKRYSLPTIEISFDAPYDRLIIQGNGKGFTHENLIKSLSKIAISKKRKDDKAIGNFGIGLHAGAKVCEEIIIETKTRGTDFVSVATMNVQDWIRKGETDPTKKLEDIITPKVKKRELAKSESKNNSYTRITLQNLFEGYRNKAQLTKLKKSLSMICFLECENTKNGKKVDLKIKELISSKGYLLPNRITLKINEEKITTPFTDKLTNLDFAFLGDKDGSPKAIATVAYKWKIIDEEERYGVYVRQKGIAVILPHKWQNYLDDQGHKIHGVARKWYTIDVHVLDDNIKPNYRRDDFFTSEEWKLVRNDLVKLTQTTVKKAYNLSKLQNQKITKTKYERAAEKYQKQGEEKVSGTLAIINDLIIANSKIVEEKLKNEPSKVVKEITKIQSYKEQKEIKVRKSDDTETRKVTNEDLINFNEEVEETLSALTEDLNNNSVEAYRLLFLIENYFRAIIDIVSNIYDNENFKSDRNDAYLVCPVKVKKNINRARNGENNSAFAFPKGDSDIYYTNTGDLSTIIETNWDQLQPFLMGDKKTFIASFSSIESFRNLIGHSVKLTETEFNKWANFVDSAFTFFRQKSQ